MDSNEDPRVALQRELEEELDVRVTLGAEVVPLADEAERDNDGFPAWPILEGRTMRVWMGQLLSDELPRPGGSHLDAIWLTFDAAQQLSWLPSNRPILTRLLAGLPA